MERRYLGAVAAVDLLIVVGLVFVGQLTHGIDPLADPFGLVTAAAPFVAGWVVGAGLAGSYRTSATEQLSTAVRRTMLAWFAGLHLALLFRAAPQTHGDIVWPFALVITGFGLVALLAWRGGLALAMRH